MLDFNCVEKYAKIAVSKLVNPPEVKHIQPTDCEYERVEIDGIEIREIEAQHDSLTGPRNVHLFSVTGEVTLYRGRSMPTETDTIELCVTPSAVIAVTTAIASLLAEEIRNTLEAEAMAGELSNMDKVNWASTNH